MTSEINKTPGFKKFVLGPIETNCYIIYDPHTKKGVLVDPSENSPVISEYIKHEKIDILWTINTHGHADHILGDEYFGYPVMIHVLDNPFLSDPGLNLSAVHDTPVGNISAERLLHDGDKVRLGDLVLEILHTPGHTPGGISIKCGGLLFSGDTLFYEGVGRTDLPGGDQHTLEASIKEKLMVLDDNIKVFPGHGPETTIGHERKYNTFF
ncbi:MAG: MBL fold metallo-hydrolase [Candidatus Aadella gelida]|nr:MBL fold metallo-hydrolase [Candidatus Aadella gelida]